MASKIQGSIVMLIGLATELIAVSQFSSFNLYTLGWSGVAIVELIVGWHLFNHEEPNDKKTE